MKMMNSLAVSAAVLAFAFTGHAGAYCVHNQSDTTMHVDQSKNGSFWKRFNVKLDPGQQACCSWTSKDCNKSGGQTDAVGFSVYHSEFNYIDCGATIPANGDMCISGTPGNYRCVPNSTTCK